MEVTNESIVVPQSYIEYYQHLQRVLNENIKSKEEIYSLYGDFNDSEHYSDFIHDIKLYEVDIKRASDPTRWCPLALRLTLETTALPKDSLDV
jgi:hypothetical protein